jgi:hypothetical protein
VSVLVLHLSVADCNVVVWLTALSATPLLPPGIGFRQMEKEADKEETNGVKAQALQSLTAWCCDQIKISLPLWNGTTL